MSTVAPEEVALEAIAVADSVSAGARRLSPGPVRDAMAEAAELLRKNIVAGREAAAAVQEALQGLSDQDLFQLTMPLLAHLDLTAEQKRIAARCLDLAVASPEAPPLSVQAMQARLDGIVEALRQGWPETGARA